MGHADQRKGVPQVAVRRHHPVQASSEASPLCGCFVDLGRCPDPTAGLSIWSGLRVSYTPDHPAVGSVGLDDFFDV